MGSNQTIFVRLLDEGVDVWRPVDATGEGNDTFVLGSTAVPEGERWEFASGSRSRCEARDLGDGTHLVAVALAGE
jgi:hypothetical protein